MPYSLMSFAAVFFDIDGTLVDSNEFHIVAWDEAFRKKGLSVSRCLLREQIGKGADKLVPALFPNMAQGERDELARIHSEIFKTRFLRQVRPFPFAAELIHELHAHNIQVLLVSSSDSKEVRHYVKLLDIEAALAGTITIDDVSHSKPEGDLFARALTAAGVNAPEALAVGDTPYDVEAAARCAVTTVALRSGGFTDPQLAASGPRTICTDIGEVFSQLLLPASDDQRGIVR